MPGYSSSICEHICSCAKAEDDTNRINGQLYIACKPYCCHYNHYLVVSLVLGDDSMRSPLSGFTEPNNASPLNADAAGLWNNAEGE